MSIQRLILTYLRWLPSLVVLAFLAALSGLLLSTGHAADKPDSKKTEWPKTTPKDRKNSALNLQQIGLAFHNFHGTYGEKGFPADAIYSKAGKPLLSWRVALLPFVEEDKLFSEFKLNEPWDSAHNKKLLARIPKIYAPTISGKPAKPNATFYQVFTGPDTPFNPRSVRGESPMSLGPRFPHSFTDGSSNTLLVVEAGEAVPWSKPADLVYDAKKPVPKLGGLFPEGFQAVLADGSVKFFGRKLEEKELRALITPSGGEVINWKKVPLLKGS
jgi:hypothetical protein